MANPVSLLLPMGAVLLAGCMTGPKYDDVLISGPLVVIAEGALTKPLTPRQLADRVTKQGVGATPEEGAQMLRDAAASNFGTDSHRGNYGQGDSTMSARTRDLLLQAANIIESSAEPQQSP